MVELVIWSVAKAISSLEVRVIPSVVAIMDALYP